MNRPTGQLQTVIGFLVLILSFVAVLAGLSERDPAESWLLLTLAAACFGIGIPLLIAGAIIRAIWHLPGRDDI